MIKVYAPTRQAHPLELALAPPLDCVLPACGVPMGGHARSQANRGLTDDVQPRSACNAMQVERTGELFGRTEKYYFS